MEYVELTNPKTGEKFKAGLNKTTPRVVQQMVPLLAEWPDRKTQLDQIKILAKQNPEAFHDLVGKELNKSSPSSDRDAAGEILKSFIATLSSNAPTTAEHERAITDFFFPQDKSLMTKYATACKIVNVAILRDSLPPDVVIDEDFWLDQEDVEGVVKAAEYFRDRIKNWA